MCRALSVYFLLFLFSGLLQAESARVLHVVDGDTVILEDRRHVRLLSINTPEVEGKKRHAESGGEAAKKWLSAQIEGQLVRLESDQQKFDKYGRSLFYLFDEQGRLINEELLANGLAVLSIHPPNLKYLPRLQQAQQHAESQKLGVWRLRAYRTQKLLQVMRKKSKGWQRVIATPLAIKESRKYVYLLLRQGANIRIAKQNLRYFPELNNYLNCTLEVRGWASWRKETLSILIRHPSALRIKHSNQCAEAL